MLTNYFTCTCYKLKSLVIGDFFLALFFLELDGDSGLTKPDMIIAHLGDGLYCQIAEVRGRQYRLCKLIDS